MEHGILINVTTHWKRQNHICFFTKEENGKLILYEVVERFYEHPDSQGNALIQRTETIRYETADEANTQSALVLLDAAQRNINNLNIF